MSSGAPPPPDFTGAAQQQADASQQAVNQQTMANRPNQSSPFATSQWTQGPDGQWQQSTQFSGALGGLNESLQQQAASAMSTPFSLSGLPELTDGSAAREQAINSAYGSATSRLDPAFQQREEGLRTRLMQQGLQPGSQAFNEAMAGLGRERTDAYGQAMNSAIGQGTQAGQALFGQSMAARQNALAEALRSRGQAFGELQGLQGLTGQQNFMGAGAGQTPQFLQAAGMQEAADFGRYQLSEQQKADLINGIMGFVGQAGGAAAMTLSDERAKQDVVRLPVDVLPGVPLATWRYLPEHGDASRVHVGVIAQDLARVAPEHVARRGDGMLMVSSLYAPEVL